MKIPDAVKTKVDAAIPLDRQVQAAHLYDKSRRWLTGTNGQKMFVERPIPPVEELALEDIDLSNPFLYRQGQWAPTSSPRLTRPRCTTSPTVRSGRSGR